MDKKELINELETIRSLFREGDYYMNIANRVLGYIDGRLKTLRLEAVTVGSTDKKEPEDKIPKEKVRKINE